MGAFAERVVLEEGRVARAPTSLGSKEAACLPLPGLCALAALDAGGVERGSRVLIHGGLGGVGSVAVQLAHARGAEVFSTVSGADAEQARQLGVDHPIDYRTQRFEDTVREVDFVFDTLGGDTLKRSWSLLRRGGALASLHVPPPAEALVAAGLRANLLLRLALPLVTRAPRAAASRAGARLFPILTKPDAAGLAELARVADTAGLRLRIDRVFPFSELKNALDHVASGKARGRVVLGGFGG
jgi:NADPH:quinone reductase-like Zn-dependent oxidoreductase